MFYNWMISFYISVFLILCCNGESLQQPPLPTQPTQNQWIKWIDRSKNRTLSRYLQKQTKDQKVKKKRKYRTNRQKIVQQTLPAILVPTGVIAAEPPPLPLPPLPPFHDKTPEKESLSYTPVVKENLQPILKEEERKLTPSAVAIEENPKPIPKEDDVETLTPPPNIHTPDLSTDFALSDIELLMKSPQAAKEVDLSKKSNSSVQPHLVNGKGVFLSIYDDRQESLAPLAPIPFLKVSSQSTFNYIEDLGVIFIPINGTYLIKYGFSGDGTYWGEECSSVQLTINETTIIPNSTITASREGVMTSQSIILPLKVNDRVRLINSTPTNSLTLVQPTPGAVTAYLEMILLE